MQHCHNALIFYTRIIMTMAAPPRLPQPQNPAPPSLAPVDLRERWMDTRYVSGEAQNSIHQILLEEDLALRGHVGAQVRVQC